MSDLHKKTPVSPLITWIDAHVSILLLISIILLLIAIGIVFGAQTGTEANIYYNQLESII